VTKRVIKLDRYGILFCAHINGCYYHLQPNWGILLTTTTHHHYYYYYYYNHFSLWFWCLWSFV